jgi:hypothetical protein
MLKIRDEDIGKQGHLCISPSLSLSLGCLVTIGDIKKKGGGNSAQAFVVYVPHRHSSQCLQPTKNCM